MRRLCLVPVCLMASWIAVASDPAEGPKAGSRAVPPVLRNQDDDKADVVVVLPGAPAPKPEEAEPKPAATPDATLTGPTKLANTLPSANGPRGSAKVFYPPAFEQDSALFCQKMIGQWTADDARFLLGQPLRQRSAYGENETVNGRIYAFSDPTGRYKELELDFESGSGLLRTVFVYPLNMTWRECRHQWGGEVSATDANKGRKFYSYVDRRLDVLVDPAGKVISFGLY